MKWNDAKVRGEESMRSQLGSLWKGRMNFRTRLDQMRFIRDGHLSEVKTQKNESIRYTKTDFTPENIDLQIKLNWKFLLKLSLGLWKITSYALSITTSRILQGKPPLNSVEISLLVASALISCRSRRLRPSAGASTFMMFVSRIHEKSRQQTNDSRWRESQKWR